MTDIPVLRIGSVLLVSIQVDLSDGVVRQLQESILTKIQNRGSAGLLIDITATSIVDSYVSRVLSETAQMANIMSCEVVLVGVQPEVAIALLEMGVELKGVRWAADIEGGLQALGYRLSACERPPVLAERDGNARPSAGAF